MVKYSESTMLENFWSKKDIPRDIPEEMEQIVKRLNSCRNKEECLEHAYGVLVNRYHGDRVNTYLKAFRLLDQDVNTLWKQKGFMHCNSLSYLLRILLVKSKWFEDADIELKWTFMWFFSPHQYLKIRMDKGYRTIDLWGKRYGIKYGDYARGFREFRRS